MPNQVSNSSSRTSSLSQCGDATPSSSGTSTPLSAETLSAQNANPDAVDQQWILEETRRVARLQQAARELGFDLPPHCYKR
ncbi:hypothetical protein M3J09_012446 [Ascochyta lentis]